MKLSLIPLHEFGLRDSQLTCVFYQYHFHNYTKQSCEQQKWNTIQAIMVLQIHDMLLNMSMTVNHMAYLTN